MGEAGNIVPPAGFEITVGLSRVTDVLIVKESVKKQRGKGGNLLATPSA
jgi:hypothetical protein